MMELQRTDNEKAPPAQSILGVMKHFIDAVNDMDETVLIPSRLMDIKMDVELENGEPNSNNMDSNLSVIPTSLKNGSSLPTEQVSLHTYYAMLKAVKRELARGPLSEDELMEEEEDSTTQGEASAKLQAKTARAFREHLRGLFTILSQLTNVSQYLTSRYQQETGDQQSCLKPKTFSV